MKSVGYSFRLTPDKIREFKDLPAEDKLDWLEEANNFIGLAVSQEKLKRWERLKAGDAGKPYATT
ncbi:MAG: hypothetical protein HZA15_01470 [Nitrospirae bacterium]|nr:hypothetical protein [Nitrospirota bacterium]